MHRTAVRRSKFLLSHMAMTRVSFFLKSFDNVPLQTVILASASSADVLHHSCNRDSHDHFTIPGGELHG